MLFGAAGWDPPTVPRDGERRLWAAWPRPRPPAPSPPSCSALSWGAEAPGAIPSPCLSFPNSLGAAQHELNAPIFGASPGVLSALFQTPFPTSLPAAPCSIPPTSSPRCQGRAPHASRSQLGLPTFTSSNKGSVSSTPPRPPSPPLPLWFLFLSLSFYFFFPGEMSCLPTDVTKSTLEMSATAGKGPR